MEWLTDLLGVGASVASGGIFGLFGSVVGVAAKHFQEKQRQEWEEKKWDQEIRLQELQLRAKVEETEQEILLANTAGSWKGLVSSHTAAANVGKTHMWVNDVKALFRPALTLVLWVLAFMVFKDLSKDEALAQYMVYSVFFSASTATVWWFGDRALTPPGNKNA